MGVHELSRTEARRIAVRAQLLDRSRPTDLVEVVRALGVLQNDQTATVAPNADLVAWSRLGSCYAPAELAEALRDGTLIELRGMIRPGADVALFRAEMAAWPGSADAAGAEVPQWRDAQADWVDANEACRLDILQRLDAGGPLTSRDLPDTCTVPWRSSGWNDNRNVRMMLGLMVARGEVATAGRRGRDTLWDLATRVYPDDTVVPAAEALRIRTERYLRSMGIARARGAEWPVQPVAAGEPAVVDGVRGSWLVDPAQLGQRFSGRAALLSPLDRLVFDRKRTAELFEFDYQLEMYKPAAQRRWGYFALPILYGDRFVGKLDATADHGHGVLRVDALHADVPFTRAMSAAVDREIRDLAGWLELELMTAG